MLLERAGRGGLEKKQSQKATKAETSRQRLRKKKASEGNAKLDSDSTIAAGDRTGPSNPILKKIKSKGSKKIGPTKAGSYNTNAWTTERIRRKNQNLF